MRGRPDPRSARGKTGDPVSERAELDARHLSRLVKDAVRAIRQKTELQPSVGVILGSGLGPVADRVAMASPKDKTEGASLETAEIPHWPRSTVHGHAGRLVLGFWSDVPVAVLRGRSHQYEGYRLDQVTYSVRVMHELGARLLFLTNAVGSMNLEIRPGSLMLVRDHLNFQGTRGLLSPGRQESVAGLPSGRPSPVYSKRLQSILHQVALEEGIALRQGTLMGGLGPAYETASEIRTARSWGADAACMSTVTEALVGAELGLEVAAISSVTNLATGLAKEKLTHDDVTDVADQVADRLELLLSKAIKRAAS